MILAPLALFLVWEVVTRSVAGYLANAWPEMAIHLQSTNATALGNLADEALDRTADAKNRLAQMRRVLEPRISKASPSGTLIVLADLPRFPPRVGRLMILKQMLRSAPGRSWRCSMIPLNARAFRILGQLAERASDDKQTQKFMQAAARRSLREGGAIYWMMVRSYQDQDYGAAIRYADTLMRTDPPKMRAVMMPIMGKIAENADASGELKKLLAGNPPWRPVFFDFLPENISDARTPLEILMSLKNTPTPPTAEDLQSYLNFLIGHKFYDLAYYTWLQFLPAEQLGKVGHLFNGSFEANPSGLPFDWVISPGSNVVMKILARPDQDGEHALFMEFGPGRVDSPGIKQLIMLPPGGYQLVGKYRAEIDSERGLAVAHQLCGRSNNWRKPRDHRIGCDVERFRSSFTVPETNCPAQYIELVFDARWASEQFISGSLWCDDLQILRDGDAETKTTETDIGTQTKSSHVP